MAATVLAPSHPTPTRACSRPGMGSRARRLLGLVDLRPVLGISVPVYTGYGPDWPGVHHGAANPYPSRRSAGDEFLQGSCDDALPRPHLDVHRGDRDQAGGTLDGEHLGQRLVVEIELAEQRVTVDAPVAQVLAVLGPTESWLDLTDTDLSGFFRPQNARRVRKDLLVPVTHDIARPESVAGSDADQGHGQLVAPPGSLLHAQQFEPGDVASGHGARSSEGLCCWVCPPRLRTLAPPLPTPRAAAGRHRGARRLTPSVRLADARPHLGHRAPLPRWA